MTDGWADFDDSSWGGDNGGANGGANAAGNSSAASSPARGTPPRSSSHGLGRKLASFKKHHSNHSGQYDDDSASVISATSTVMSAMSNASIATKLTRKIGKMRGLAGASSGGGGGGGSNYGGRTPPRGYGTGSGSGYGSSSRRNHHDGGFGGGGGFGSGGFGSGNNNNQSGGFADFARFDSHDEHDDDNIMGDEFDNTSFGNASFGNASFGNASFGDAHSAVSGGGSNGGGGDPFAVVATPDRGRYGSTYSAGGNSSAKKQQKKQSIRKGLRGKASPGRGSSYVDDDDPPLVELDDHDDSSIGGWSAAGSSVGAGGGGGVGGAGGGGGSSSRMSKFSFLRNSSRRSRKAGGGGSGSGGGSSGSAAFGSSSGSGGPTASSGGGGGAETRESMKRTWDHSRKLAALAATPGPDGKRPGLSAAPYSPASAYAGSDYGRSPGAAAATPTLRDAPQSWQPRWGGVDDDDKGDGGDALSQGVAALASGNVQGFDPYGIGGGTTTTTASAAATSAAREDGTPRHSNLQQQQQQQAHSNNDEEDPFFGGDAFAADFGSAAFDPSSATTAVSTSTGRSSSGRQQHPSRSSEEKAMKSPHTHMSPSTTRKQQVQQEQYQQQQQQDDVVDPFHHTGGGGGGGGSVSSSASTTTPPRGGSSSASASLLSMSGGAAGRRRTRLTPPRPGSATHLSGEHDDDDVGSVVSGVSGVSIGGNSASAAAARRKMRKSMQQARKATGRSQAVLGAGAAAGDDNSTQGSTAATAETTITSSAAGNIVGSTQYYNALSDASPRHGGGLTSTTSSTAGRGSAPGSAKVHGWLARERTGSAGSSSGGRPPLSPPPSSKNVMFTDDHSAGHQSTGSDDFNSFDAFGLDSRDIDKEVNAALGDLVGSHPDLGFFLDQRSSRSMSSSFGGGSTASPHPGSVRSSSAGGGSAGSSAKGTYGGSTEDLHQTISPEGDAVGPLPFNSPVVSTDHHSETSSVTCSSHGQGQGGPGAQQQQQPRSNQFKEAAMANSRTRRIVRPGQFDGKSPIPPRHTGGSVHDRMNGIHAAIGPPDLEAKDAIMTEGAASSSNKYAERNPANRLRKDIQRRKQHASSVSDIGASTRRSQPEFNAVLDRMKKERDLSSKQDMLNNHSDEADDEESRQSRGQQQPQHLVSLKHVPQDAFPRDAMSDVGAPTGSLFMASTKLKKTGRRLSDGRGHQQNDEGTAETARETPSTFHSEVTEERSAFFGGDQFDDDNIVHARRSEPVMTPVSSQPAEPAPKKMTYRERRELELKEQAELERRRAAEEAANKEPEVDVAELVRRRVAANRQKDSFPRVDTDIETSGMSPVSPDDALKDMRSRLKSPTSDSVSSHPQSVTSPSSDDALAGVRSRLKKVSVNTDRSPSPSMIPQFSPAARAAEVNASPAFEGEEADPMNERPQIPVAALMAQRQTRAKPAEVEPNFEPETERPQISVAALMAQRLSAASPDNDSEDNEPQARHSASASLRGPSPVPSDSKSSMVSDDSKNKLSALFASRSALLPSKKASAAAEDLGAKQVLKKTNKSKSVTAAASVASLIGKRGGKNRDTSADVGGSDGTGAATSSAAGRPALKDDPKYSKYFKMMKMGLPLPAVKHAMTRDGLDPDVLDGDHDQPAVDSDVPLKEDPKYSKYFKMLKMGLPLEAVKHAMTRDGLDESVMDGDHNAPAPSESAGSKKSKKREKDTHRRTRLHWGAMDKVNSNSIWALVDGDQDVEDIDIDEDEFAQLFQEEIVKGDSKKGGNGGSGGGSKKDVVKVIDPKRANNGGIVLARLKMSYDEMAKAVDTIDERAMTEEQMQGILEYIPDASERKALRKYMTSSSKDAVARFEALCECEKFMVAMMTVKHSKRKIKALLFKSQFAACLEDLARDAVIVEQSCEELKNSVRFRKLLGIVLNLGNRLNTAGSGKKSKARGLSLESLLKLSQAKAFDKKTTFLHYVVLVVQRNNELLLRFKDDIPNVMKADKVHWDQCLSDLEEVENQLENVRKIALYEARNVLSAKTRKKWKKSAGADDDELPDIDISLEEEVAALRSTEVGIFTLNAIKKVSALRDKVEWTNKRFGRLCEYLGEESSRKHPHEVFKIMVTFCRDFDRAVSDVEKQQKAKARARRKEQQRQQAASDKASDGPNPGDSRPSSEHRSNPLKDASVLEKAKLQNPAGMASVLDEIQKKQSKGQNLLRKTAVPPRPPGGQENYGQPPIGNVRASTAYNAYTRSMSNKPPAQQDSPSRTGMPGNAVDQASNPALQAKPRSQPPPQQQQQQQQQARQTPSVDVRGAPAGTDPPSDDSPVTSPRNTPTRTTSSLRNHALRDKVRQRRQRRQASSPRASAPASPYRGADPPASSAAPSQKASDGSVEWPFPRNIQETST